MRMISGLRFRTNTSWSQGPAPLAESRQPPRPDRPTVERPVESQTATPSRSRTPVTPPHPVPEPSDASEQQVDVYALLRGRGEELLDANDPFSAALYFGLAGDSVRAARSFRDAAEKLDRLRAHAEDNVVVSTDGPKSEKG